MPIDLMKRAVREAAYITIMNACICRDGQNCTTYPKDLGCIFIGKGSRVLEERKIGRRATVEEAIAHIDRGAELGLIGNSLWIEVEQYVWGIKDEDMHRFLEFCFCCPCCCTALKIAKNSTIDVRQRFRSVGWKAIVVDSAINTCKSCTICTNACPMEAISNQDGITQVSEEMCLGCGICAAKCPNKSIQLKLKDPIKPDIKDYFSELDLEL